ncbi:hypothetical protein IL992_16855 [Microbispora sp. NEAU-D428]|uniref:hypothetical protein n=1 Tax=Microbispora sitophila TaxID=2771537 RepID=UPI0018679732|nr:hypothetical protein [Microbispora sitophila]MBE3010853.1 hypothetical protein [Microbispora sitophila]
MSPRSRTLRALKIDLLTLVGCFLGLVLLNLVDEPVRSGGWRAVSVTLAVLAWVLSLVIIVCFVFAVVDGLKVVKRRRERSRG